MEPVLVHLADFHRFGYGICGAKGETSDGGRGGDAPQGITCDQCLGLFAKIHRRAMAYEDEPTPPRDK